MIHRINHSTPTESPKLESTIVRTRPVPVSIRERGMEGVVLNEEEEEEEAVRGSQGIRDVVETGRGVYVGGRESLAGSLSVQEALSAGCSSLPGVPLHLPPPNSVEREGGTKMVVGREGGNAKGEGSVGRCAAIFHPWRDGYRESASSDNEAS